MPTMQARQAPSRKTTMSLFKWFSGKSTPTRAASAKDSGPFVRDSRVRSQSPNDKPAPAISARAAVDPGNRSEERKVKRHARREQLYLAIREAFTHAGVLSATYKFKVLSLDQAGNEFLVMMDVDQAFDHRADKLAHIESRVVQIAKTSYEIRVTSVYWRVSTSAVTRNTNTAPQNLAQTAAVQASERVTPPAKKTPGLRYDPIQDDEVAAFKQALMAASAKGTASADTTSKSRSGPRSYTLLTGFEDTEMPESAGMPVLSATQYGDLN